MWGIVYEPPSFSLQSAEAPIAAKCEVDQMEGSHDMPIEDRFLDL